MAIIAGRRDDEPHLEQGLAMDAVHVLRRRFGKSHLIFFCQPRVAVAFGASLRQVQLEHGRRGVPGRQDAV